MKKRACGYIRVSSKDQAEGTSLDTQRAAIEKYAADNDWTLTEIYADAGISGADMEKRKALLQLLKDAAARKFDVMICDKHDRFGRDLKDIVVNRYTLNQFGVKDVFLEGVEDPQLLKNVRAVIAEEERTKIRERTIRGRLHRLENGIPIGCKPFNRKYDYETGEWSFIDPRKNELIRWAAEEYLRGESMTVIARLLTNQGWKISQAPLNRYLRYKCGDTWTYHLDGKEFQIPMPPILEKHVIDALHRRMEHRKTNNRVDVKRYALSGYLRCEKCGRALTGHTMRDHWTYYKHPTTDCNPGYIHVPLPMMDEAVFKSIRGYVMDVQGYRKAVAEKAPDDKMTRELEQDLKRCQKALDKAEQELDNLYQAVAKGTLTNKEYIAKHEKLLTDAVERDKLNLVQCKLKLDKLPTRAQYEADAERIRRDLLLKFSTWEHLLAMPYENKRRVLYQLFSGKDLDGRRYGIYIDPRQDNEKGKRHAWWRFTIRTEFMEIREIVRFDGLFFSNYGRGRSLQRRRSAKKNMSPK